MDDLGSLSSLCTSSPLRIIFIITIIILAARIVIRNLKSARGSNKIIKTFRTDRRACLWVGARGCVNRKQERQQQQPTGRAAAVASVVASLVA